MSLVFCEQKLINGCKLHYFVESMSYFVKYTLCIKLVLLLHIKLFFVCFVFCFTLNIQFGVRSEGVQEALLKIRDTPESADRITKMKEAIKAVSLRDRFTVENNGSLKTTSKK